MMNHYSRFVIAILIFVFGVWFSSTSVSAHYLADSAYDQIAQAPQVPTISLPTNFFVRTVASGLSLPTDMVILSSGDLLIAQKGSGNAEFGRAQVRLVRDGVLQPKPVLSLGVNTIDQSGLLGIAIDPQFESNHFFYLWYGTGVYSLEWAGTSFNRLSRFVFDPVTGTAELASEKIVLDEVDWSPYHNGGGLVFDNEGNLLITTGDTADSRNPPEENIAQKLTSLGGKVLRIRPTADGGYDIPSDNPFADEDEIRPEIYSFGLREPYRIDQRAADQEFYLIEVGEAAWEEVNVVMAEANYGWPYREGICGLLEIAPNCTPTPAEFTDPLYAYPHPAEGGAGLTAMSFYEGTLWPVKYQGLLFITDFNSQWIGTLNVDAPAVSFETFAIQTGLIVDMEATPEGLYLVNYSARSIQFLYYDATGNHPPIAAFKSSTSGGAAPVQVEFTATAMDADNDKLFYTWDFGDGITLTTEIATATHVYTHDGDFVATLQVVDEDNGKSDFLTALVQVYSGEVASIVQENLTEPERILYNGGDQIRFSTSRTGGETGLDPIAPYTWAIWLHHNQHEHVEVIGFIDDTVTFDVPRGPHALDEPMWYVVELSMQTSNGQVIKTTQEFHPQMTKIQVQSWPNGSQITINGEERSHTEVTPLVVGAHYTLEAPLTIKDKGQAGQFAYWIVTDSWPRATRAGDPETIFERVYTLAAPEEPRTYIAFYEYTGAANLTYLPSVGN